MKVRGRVAQLDRKPSGDPALAFWLATENDRIPVEAVNDKCIRDGDTVEVSGTTNSNGTLIADDITTVTGRRIPWKIVLSAGGAAVITLVAYLLTRPTASSSLTVIAMFCDKPSANTEVSMFNSSRTFTCTTNVQGTCTITHLPAGMYTIRVGIAQRAGITVDGKTEHPPVTINTSQTVFCLHPPILHPLGPNVLKTPPRVIRPK